MKYFLKPGFIYFAMRPTLIYTVVGSGVAILLHDKRRQLGGMNHFVHPMLESGEKATALYARPATLQLVKMFRSKGSDAAKLEAHLYGGGYPDWSDSKLKGIGEKNLDQAKELMDRMKIPVVGTDTGGTWGRKIVFNSASGEVVVAKVNKIRNADWFYQRLWTENR